MLPKKGNSFPGGNDRENGGADYAKAIATALRTELGNTHQATKTVMRWTGASERTVKHWIAGGHGPKGAYLLVLMRESEAVFEAVLSAAGRRDAVVAARILAAHGTMVEAMAMAQRERSSPSDPGLMGPDQGGEPSGAAPDDRKNDRDDDRDDVRDNDRDNDRKDNPASVSPGDGLNSRQRWFLDTLADGDDVKAEDLRRRWRVSEKTARRDVAALKARGMIEFVGAARGGNYRLRR